MIVTQSAIYFFLQKSKNKNRDNFDMWLYENKKKRVGVKVLFFFFRLLLKQAGEQFFFELLSFVHTQTHIIISSEEKKNGKKTEKSHHQGEKSGCCKARTILKNPGVLFLHKKYIS